MRVLWSVFIVFPEVAEKVGMKPLYACTWVRAMAEKFRRRDDVKLAVVTVGNAETVQKYEVDNIDFYFLPGGKKVYQTGGGDLVKNAWNEIIADFKPDVIHAYGTEYAHNKTLIEMKQSVPVVISLQGILKDYEKDYYGGLNVSTGLKYLTLRDIVRGSGIIMDRIRLKKAIETEVNMLRQVDHVEGRTFWDYASVKDINPNAKYHYCPRMIRKEFYTDERWDINKIERHSIFVHQGFKPLKGFHFLIEAVAKLRKKYPDIKIYVAGNNNLELKTLKKKLLASGYVIYINKLIDKLGVRDCIEFTGPLDAAGMVKVLKKAHVMVLPSAIENSPNSLVEAMLVGTPCISSFVGGVPEMLDHGREGLLYCYTEVNVLAQYIERIFESDEMADSFSVKAREHAMRVHDPEKLEKMLMDIYKDIVNG